MASSPIWKVYNTNNEYIASCKYAEDAAILVTANMGGTIRDGHRKKAIAYTYTEGTSEGYGEIASICNGYLRASILRNQ